MSDRNRNSSTTNRNMLYRTVSTNHLAVSTGKKQTETCPHQTDTCIIIKFVPHIGSCNRNRNSSTTNRNMLYRTLFTTHLAVSIGQKQTETCPHQTCPQQADTCIIIQFYHSFALAPETERTTPWWLKCVADNGKNTSL